MLIINPNLEDLPEFLAHPQIMYFTTLIIICLLALCFLQIKRTSCKVYLIDFVCYKPPSSQKCTKAFAMKQAVKEGFFTEELLEFMRKSMERSGLGDSTYLSDVYFKDNYVPSMKDSRREVEVTVFSSIDMLLAKTGIRCEDIGILISNCCIYNTAPSLSSMIVNRYNFRENTITYNISGMGCSAGLLAIGLAKQLLQVHHNSYVMIVSTESITENCYTGLDRSKFLTNILFRLGGAAILLSNRRSDDKNSKYQLLHTIHTNTSSSDRSYKSILREEDAAGIVGVTITKDLLTSAVATIKPNLTIVGHLVLPIEEKFLCTINYIARKLLPAWKMKRYTPNFSNGVDHFLPHVGGKMVLDDLQRILGFSDENMEPSRMTLYRFGNTSSSSIWYGLAYEEAKNRVKKGNRVWQIAFGSGFKCNSVIWRAIRTVDHDDKNPWMDEIADFPLSVGEFGPFPIYFDPSK